MNHRILFGDIHNHNAHGYGVGSIERSMWRARISTFSPSPATRAGTTCDVVEIIRDGREVGDVTTR